MIKYYDCARPGCGKIVGAQRIEDNKVVEEEWVPGHCTEDVVDGKMRVLSTAHFCSIECANKKEEFMDPREIMEDADE